MDCKVYFISSEPILNGYFRRKLLNDISPFRTHLFEFHD